MSTSAKSWVAESILVELDPVRAHWWRCRVHSLEVCCRSRLLVHRPSISTAMRPVQGAAPRDVVPTCSLTGLLSRLPAD